MMKTSLCWIVAAASLYIQPVRAQIGDRRTDFAVGVNGGYTMNQVSFDPSIKQTWKGAPTFGLTMRYTCEKYFKSLCAIQMEVNYANLGWKEVIETSTDTYERDVHYIQVPVLARMGWGYERKGAMFYAVAGPQLGFCIGDSDKRGGAFNEETLMLRPNHVVEQYDLPIKNKFDYGITAGLGVELNCKAGHFMLEGRYYYALGDMFGNGKKDVFGRSANGAIVAKLTYLIDVIRTKR
ncbi:MAG: PorT family protein [Clostridium sp.]|nr:PorT family protein [Clostridium sp.]